MNYTKQTYEDLIILHNRLCKSSINDYLEIVEGISHNLEEVKRCYLFPLNLSADFYNTLSERENLDFERNKLKLAKELYIYLAKMMFSFLWADIYKMNSYRIALELGRTEFPYEQANDWCIDYIKIQEFTYDSFFFCINRDKLYFDNKNNYAVYKNELRLGNCDIFNSFPKETTLPKDVIDSFSSLITEKYKMYMDYVENNYSFVKYAFPSYNKQIRVYISLKYGNCYEFVMNMYDSQSYSVQIYPNDVVYLYRFSNVEAIDDKISNGINSGFTYPDYKDLDYLFSISSIHFELNRLFVRYASVDDLRDYLIYMLRGRLKKVSILSDKTIIIGDEKCMLLFDNVPTVDVLQKQLDKERVCDYKYMAFRSNPDDSTRKMLETNNISIIDVNHLGTDLINNQNGDMIHWFIKSRLSNLQIDESYKAMSLGDVLIKKLENCPKGKEGWKQYEDIGGEIFSFLFADSFRNYTYEFQSPTADGIFRRDMVVNNTFKDSPSFWQLVKSDYKSNLIIIDFKNYKDQLNQDEFFNPSKYMTKLSGNFAIIFSRYGLDESAKKFQIKLLEENKLLLCLSDANLIDLITQKTNGQNPLCSLENIYYDLCKSK